ncbi:MAG: protein-L-isoaspartate O-methyltransferase [Gammaproteobacteria bacterium]|jgi:protein-L-isoaspartate(D-aspartate) O-methyltransferase|nr:protein-L-isoaspartate O-methyltransferase [Gammaproteobacteria bacterium]HJP05357.1 protein-L-isoaspartate O-methyltransferase [Gammaproteobacteria bacterium]
MHTETARHQMIYHQVRPWDVSDNRVLEALGNVPREQFVPVPYRDLAFADTTIPLPCGQHMLKPVQEGRLLQALEPNPGDRALVIGIGSGFLSAVLARLVDHVTSVDIHAELIDTASVKLADEKIRNVELKLADFNEMEPGTKFNRILIAGSMPLFDPRLPDWLEPDGRLVVIIGSEPNMDVEGVVRTGSSYTRTRLFETVVQRLENVPIPEAFEF